MFEIITDAPLLAAASVAFATVGGLIGHCVFRWSIELAVAIAIICVVGQYSAYSLFA